MVTCGASPCSFFISRLALTPSRSDLPPRAGSVLPASDFRLAWEVPARARPRLQAISEALQAPGVRSLVLATDPDREGEAIGWHVWDALRSDGALPRGVSVSRAAFNEVTKSAVLAALGAPRALADDLVDAYRARRALDYLVGFSISPLLWRKLPGARSAGRVQSVALRLVDDRAAAIEAFKPRRYWSVGATLRAPCGTPFKAALVALDGRALGRFPFDDQASAHAAVTRLQAATDTLRVTSLTRRPHARAPPAPFTTSSLQQAASSSLGMGASATMALAQRLYEAGHITYMRTDGVYLAPEAAAALRQTAARRYGDTSVPSTPRVYASKAKNAQEAHEAIRPTDSSASPASLPGGMARGEIALYGLIWRRALASQMCDARTERLRVEVRATLDGSEATLRATGSTLLHPGWLAAMTDPEGAPPPAAPVQDASGEGESEGESESEAPQDKLLPPLQSGDALGLRAIGAEAHATAPPGRFTEGTLVQALEAAGVGRPSTYAPTLRLLLDRGYVLKEGASLWPSPLGRVVHLYLTAYFPKLIQDEFTASMETSLDDVAGGRIPWRTPLAAFWAPFDAQVKAAALVTPRAVIDELDARLGAFLFPAPTHVDDDDGAQRAATAGSEACRACPACATGRLGLKLSPAGGFIGCSNYETQKCSFQAPLAPLNRGADGTPCVDADAGASAPRGSTPHVLGHHPVSGEAVTLRLGPYGPYVQLGEETPAIDAPPPRPSSAYVRFAAAHRAEARASAALGGASRALGAAWKASAAAAERAALEADAARDTAAWRLACVAWAAAHPGAADGASAAKASPRRASLPKGTSADGLSLEASLALLALPLTLGPHPRDGHPVLLKSGPFGLYMQHGEQRASLSAGALKEAGGAAGVTLQAAVDRLAAKAAKGASAPPRRARPVVQKGAKRSVKAAKTAAAATARLTLAVAAAAVTRE